MKYVTSHIMGVRLQTFKLLGLAYQSVPFTSLNELFNIQSGVAAPNGVAPNMTYLAIGNGGHVNATTADGLAYPQLVNHSPRDCALIRHLPFILREATDDLDVATRNNYGLRQAVTINGTNYIGYYLRKIDLTNAVISLLNNQVQDGVTSTTPWTPTSDNLHPTPVIPSSTGVVVATGDYVSTQAVLTVTLSQSDITELMNVAQVLYGNSGLAIISEAGLVAGSPSVITAQQSGGQTLSYTEVLQATLCSSLSSYYHLPSLNQNLTLNFDVGGAESLYGVDDGTQTNP